MVAHIGGDALAKIGFEGVHAHLHEGLQFCHEPLCGSRVGKVHDAHASLPQISLPDISVWPVQQISVMSSLLKKW